MKAYTHKILNTAFLALFLLMAGKLAIAQNFPPWPAPDEANAINNPVEPKKESISAGKALFEVQCKACHGAQGRGDGLIKAANLATPEFIAQTDGAIHWKLITGRGQMPAFKMLPEDQLWNIINYVRSLGEKKDAVAMKNAVISLSFNEKADSKEVTAFVQQVLENGEKIPAANIAVNFGIRRYFGTLPFTGNPTPVTGQDGKVTVKFPNNIIGDADGNLTVIASIDDMDYNPAEVKAANEWGSPKANDYWSTRRALWKDNDHIPGWLFAGFLLTTLSIWGFIFYVLFLIGKIKLEGDKVAKDFKES